jgi:hypothetical protein
MKINIKLIKKLNACEEGIIWFKNKYGKKTTLEILAKDLVEEYKYNWLSWFITKNLNKDDNVRYAIFAAELVIHIFEEKYPNDDRPRKAIQAAKDYLETKSAIAGDALAAGDAAGDAALAARDAAWAAGDAAGAAALAAGDAALAARDAAWAAGDAAGAAAWAAAWDAARAAAYKKILDYGISLLKKESIC